MTDYNTKWGGSIKTIDATGDAGKKTQADVEAENYVYGVIPESDFYTCIDKANDAAYVLLRIGEGAKQEIGCSCDYFKKERKTCEHLYALRDIDASKLDASPNWLVEFLQVNNSWHIDDNNKLVPPSMDDGGIDFDKLNKEFIEEEKDKKEPEKQKKTCPHCNLTMPESRYEKHLSVCKKNPEKQKPQGSPTVEPPAQEKPKAPVIPPDPEIDIGVNVELEPQKEKPVEESKVAESPMVPKSIAEAMCNMQKTELFAITDSDNPFYKSKYADLASIWSAIRKPLTDNGLAVIQTTEPYEDGITVVTTLVHVSGEKYETKLSGKMDKQSIQGLGSLITYLRRYSLAALVGVASMEELVNKLAELQAELKAEEAKADEASALTDASITDVKDELAELEKERAFERRQYIQAMQEINATIKETETQLVDEWDGEKKTLKYPAGTLSFRRTGSLRIIDDVRLMEMLIEKAPIFDVVRKYIKGFKLTGVKKFVEVHNVQTGVASMEYKTTVKLELSG
jgi:hypothetical protein